MEKLNQWAPQLTLCHAEFPKRNGFHDFVFLRVEWLWDSVDC